MLPYSIIIPTRDRNDLLCRAVESALIAAAPMAEIIVSDDASKTPASSILGHFRDTRLRVVQAEGKGPGHARNRAMEAARGKVLFFLDDDDELMPDYCARIMSRLANNPNPPEFGYSAFILQNGQRQTKKCRAPDGPIVATQSFQQTNLGFGMGFWIMGALAKRVGPISEEWMTNEDTEYCLRLLGTGRPGWYSATPGVIVHKASVDSANVASITQRTASSKRSAAFDAIAHAHVSLIDQIPGAQRYFDRRRIKTALSARLWTKGWRIACARPVNLPYFAANLVGSLFRLRQ